MLLLVGFEYYHDLCKGVSGDVVSSINLPVLVESVWFTQTEH